MEQTQILVLEQQLKYHAELIEKMSIAIERLANASTDMTKILSVHEERYSQTLKNNELIYDVIQENKQEVKEIETELKQEIKQLEDELKTVVKKTDVKLAYGIGSVIATILFSAFSFYQQYVDFQVQTKYKIEQRSSK